jgi:hypothetical protein
MKIDPGQKWASTNGHPEYALLSHDTGKTHYLSLTPKQKLEQPTGQD